MSALCHFVVGKYVSVIVKGDEFKTRKTVSQALL